MFAPCTDNGVAVEQPSIIYGTIKELREGVRKLEATLKSYEKLKKKKIPEGDGLLAYIQTALKTQKDSIDAVYDITQDAEKAFTDVFQFYPSNLKPSDSKPQDFFGIVCKFLEDLQKARKQAAQKIESQKKEEEKVVLAA